MARRGFPLRRSAIEWFVRIALTLSAAILGHSAVNHALADSLSGNAVDRAHAMAPDNGQITALFAQKMIGADASAIRRAKADAFARLALLQDPTASPAVAVLGINAQIRGGATIARPLFTYAQTLSRRNLPAQLWSAEEAVARDDIPGALRHYDIALRTSPIAPELMFPVLASAIVDPGIQKALIKTLTAKPSWAPDFISYVAGNGADPRATARLFIGLRRMAVPVPKSAQSAMINTLISRGYNNVGWAYYKSANPSVDRRTSRDPYFTTDPESPSFFDWSSATDAGINTAIQPGTKQGIFDFSTPPSIGGVLLQQMQLLPPGEYVLEGHSLNIDQPAGAHPYWTLQCSDGHELGRIDLPNSTEVKGMFSGRFSVPSDCPAQTLWLVARPSSVLSGVSGQIDRALLRPVDR